MLRLLLRLTPANVMYELGSGRALDNARREREEVERTTAVVDALVGRLDLAPAGVPEVAAPQVGAGTPGERVAA